MPLSVDGAGKGANKSQLVAIWNDDQIVKFEPSWTTISPNDMIIIDTTGFTEAKLQVNWNPDGDGQLFSHRGEHRCWVVGATQNQQLLVISDNLSYTPNLSSWQPIQQSQQNRETWYNLQCFSNAQSDLPKFYQAIVWLR